jgi:hypothetical protein
MTLKEIITDEWRIANMDITGDYEMLNAEDFLEKWGEKP